MSIKPSNLLFVLLYCFMISSCTAFRTVSPSTSEVIAATNPADQLRAQVVSFAQKQVGAKYQYAGRSPRGFDCSGLTYYVMKNHDVQLPSNSGMQSKEGRPIDPRKVRAGDLVFFKRSKLGGVFHVALVVSNGAEGIRVVHSTSSRGVIEENISQSTYWKPKIASARSVLP